ncbi:MAG: aminomethyltransferase family protein [Deltaproteobacteria bacterium]|jgi:aminomethyltransferase|nr:aminomethyltransferase family protein [Deltaproteobacteria bacterium]
MKQTCFHEVNLEAGAKMVEMFGFALPWEYPKGGAAEHVATREAAGLVDLGYMAKFHITGPDSLKFLQKLLSVDVASLKIGQIRYTTLLSDQGLMVDDATIWKYKENDYVLVTGDDGDVDWIEQQAKGLSVTIVNDTFNSGALQVQGPKAHEIMRKFTGGDPLAVKYYHFKEMKIDGHDVVVAKMSYTGSGGFEYHVFNKDARWLWESLLKIGGPEGMIPMGQCALESLRQESGYLLVGNDHDKTRNPLEAGIAQTIRFDKADFNGKAALLKIAKAGIDKRIVWLRLADATTPKTGDPILLEGEKVGTVTSGSFQPIVKKGTAVGYVDIGKLFPGLTYKIATDGAEHKASLSLVPLFNPTGEIRRY